VTFQPGAPLSDIETTGVFRLRMGIDNVDLTFNVIDGVLVDVSRDSLIWYVDKEQSIIVA
jgi:hypothetical protein